MKYETSKGWAVISTDDYRPVSFSFYYDGWHNTPVRIVPESQYRALVRAAKKGKR